MYYFDLVICYEYTGSLIASPPATITDSDMPPSPALMV